MQAFNELNSMDTHIRLSGQELATVQAVTPRYIASAIADKFVEEYWPKIKKDKAFMKSVKGLSVEKSSTLIADILTKQLNESLGIKER